MKRIYVLRALLWIGCVLGVVACSEEFDDYWVVEDYAITEYREPDSLSLALHKDGRSATWDLYAERVHRKQNAGSRYSDLSKRYGDHVDKRVHYKSCTYYVGIVSAQMLQKVSPDAAPIDVSSYYQLYYRNFRDYVTKRPRMKQRYRESMDSISLADCTGDTCMWLFAKDMRGVGFVGGADAPAPDSTTTFVLTLSDGRQLRAPWLPKRAAQ